MKKAHKNTIINRIKYLVGIILIIFIISKIEFNDMIYSLQNINYMLLCFAVIVFGISGILQGARLYFLIRQFGFKLGPAIKIFFISTFFNNLSTLVVGDFYKIAIVKKRSSNLHTPIAIIFLERTIGFVSVVCICIAYIIFSFSKIKMLFDKMNIKWGLDLDTTIGIGLFVLLMISILLILFYKKFLTIVLNFFRTLRDIIYELEINRLFSLFVLSVLAQLLFAYTIYFLIGSLHETMHLFDVLFIVVLTFIASYIPISIGSLGVREGITVIGLTYYGVTAASATAVALLSRIIIYIYAAFGGLLFLSYKKQEIY